MLVGCPALLVAGSVMIAMVAGSDFDALLAGIAQFSPDWGGLLSGSRSDLVWEGLRP